MKTPLLTAILFILTAPIHSQDFNHAKMDSLFDAIDANQKSMGSLSLFYDGHEIYHRSIGYADVEMKLLANQKTKYRIGSISKSFTATIIMQLIEKKKLSLETKLSEYFPTIPNASKINIEQMLRHRSGLHNFTDDDSYLNWNTTPQTHSQMIARITTDFEPDEQTEYSNTNYVLLSYIAEMIEKKDFASILQKKIVKPCGLKNTFVGGKIDPSKNEAHSYKKLKNWDESSETDMSIPAGAGAIVSTPTDLNTFYRCLFGGKILNKTSLDYMKKIEDGYGAGLFKIPFHDKWAFGHTGGIDDFHSMAASFENEKLEIAYCSNGEVMSMNDILVYVLSIYFKMETKIPDFTPAVIVSTEQLNQYIGTYSSPNFPLKITISNNENVLMAQATGQSLFPLEAVAVHQFKFEPAGIEIEFLPLDNKLILRQAGGMFEMKKE